MRLHILGGPLVDRGHGTVRLRAAAVVLEEQVLGHRGLLVSWAAYRGPSPDERSRSKVLDIESHAAREGRSGRCVPRIDSPRSGLAGLRPEVDRLVDGMLVDARQLLGREVEVAYRGDVVLELADPGRAD